MEVQTSVFSKVIEDHLALRERNRPLERSMPIERYMTRDPFENHPLFKTEEQARIEETMDGVENGATPVETQDETEERTSVDDSLWGRSRDFDWGD
jgi:hypothetical protein